MAIIKNYRELHAYGTAIGAAMRVFDLSRTFPALLVRMLHL
jgi:hypothetical protein